MEYSLIGLAALGFAAGAYGAVIGAGGGFMLVPALLLIYPDYEPEEVTSISLAVVFLSAASGSVAYAWRRRIDYVTGLLFAASSTPGVLAGAIVVRHVPARVFTTAFGVMLMLVAAVSFRGRGQAVRRPLTGSGVLVRRMVDPEGRMYRYAYLVWQGVALSLGIGFVSSLFGIGGGVIQVPVMVILLHVPVHYAVATSQFTLVFMAGGASLIHLVEGTLGGEQLARAAALGVGAVPGAQAGAFVAQRIRARNILLLLAAAIVVLGARLVLKGAAGL